MKVEEAANELEHIIESITNDIDDDARLELRDRLIELKRNMPWDPEFSELRRMAKETYEDLGEAINESVLQRMRARGKEMDKHAEIISAVTKKAEKDVETLRLKQVFAITASANKIAISIQAIRASLQANNLEDASLKTEQALQLALGLIGELSSDT